MSEKEKNVMFHLLAVNIAWNKTILTTLAGMAAERQLDLNRIYQHNLEEIQDILVRAGVVLPSGEAPLPFDVPPPGPDDSL